MEWDALTFTRNWMKFDLIWKQPKQYMPWIIERNDIQSQFREKRTRKWFTILPNTRFSNPPKKLHWVSAKTLRGSYNLAVVCNDDVTIADDWGMDMFKIQRINDIHLMDKFWRSRSVEQISQPQSIKCNYVFSVLFMFSFWKTRQENN